MAKIITERYAYYQSLLISHRIKLIELMNETGPSTHPKLRDAIIELINQIEATLEE